MTREAVERLTAALDEPFGHYAGEPEGTLALVSVDDLRTILSQRSDLAEALEALLNITGDMHNEDFDEFKNAEAALAKARGEQS